MVDKVTAAATDTTGGTSVTIDATKAAADTSVAAPAETKVEAASEVKTEPSLLEGASAEKTPDETGGEKAEGAETKTETKPDALPADAGKDKKDAKPASETKDAGKSEPPKPDGKKPDGKDGAKDAAVEKPPAQSEPHAFEAFTVPDGTKLDDKQVATFTGILNNAEFSPQQRAQALVDMHVGEMQRLTQQAAQQQRDVWTQQQNRWRDDFRADKEIGGNRAATSLGLAKSLIEELGGTEEEVKATLAMLSYTGAGNHVGLIRVLHNAALRLSREGEPDTADPPNSAQGKSRQEKWYGANGKATP